MGFFKRYLPVLLIAIYFLLQILFINSDPDNLADPYSRGAWTDEGLYVSQIKNLVNHGSFDITESPVFVITPLYSVMVLPFFYVLGTKLLVSRLVTLCFSLIILFFLLKNKNLNLFGIFLLLVGFAEVHIFQFMHYGMVEMICISWIMLGLFFFHNLDKIKNMKVAVRKIFLVSLCLFCAYAAKISFLYCAMILPAATFFLAVAESTRYRKFKNTHFVLFYWSLVFTIIFFLLYILCWYLPVHQLFHYGLFYQSSPVYSSSFILIVMDAWYIFLREFWTGIFKVNIIHFILVVFAAIFFFVIKKRKVANPALIAFSVAWILFELHKLPMLYLPYRYMLGFFMAAAVFIAAFYVEFLYQFKKHRFILSTIVLVIGMINLYHNAAVYSRRTFKLEAINNYLKNYDFQERPVIGPWASSCCWKNKAKTVPVWYDFFNWKDPIRTLKPAIVVSEPDELDSDHAYKQQGIDLEKISDSSRVFDAYTGTIVIYWIKKSDDIK
jgi:hypothetical protein